MRQGLIRSLGLICVLFGCDARSEFLPPPMIDGASAMIIITRSSEGELTFLAQDAESVFAVLPAVSEITLLVYTQTLEELGLASGRFVPTDLGCVFGEAKGVFRVEEDLESLRWARLEDASEIFAALITNYEQRCLRCRNAVSKNIMIQPEGRKPTAAAFLSDDRLLIARPLPGALSIMDDSGATIPVAGCGDAEISWIEPVGADRFWLGHDSALSAVEVDAAAATCTLTSSLSASGVGRIVAMDGVFDARDPEIFVGTDEARFFLVTASAVEPVTEFGTNSTTIHVVRTGPRQAVMTAGALEVGVWDDGALEEVSAGIGSLGRFPEFRRVIYVESIGILVGSNIGTLYELVDGRLVEFDSPLSVTSPVGALVEFEDGFLAVSSGQLYQWYSQTGFCPPSPIGGLTNQNARLTAGADAAFIPVLGTNPASAWIAFDP